MNPKNVRRTVAKTVNRSAHQLTEAVLAKALQGDSTAMLAAVILLHMVSGRDTNIGGVTARLATEKGGLDPSMPPP